MKINYDITGQVRKALAGAIGQELGATPKYLGMPSADYEVGGYHIDTHGVVTGADDARLVASLRNAHGFEPVGEEYDAPSPEPTERLAIEVPRTGFTPEKLENLTKMVAAKAPLLRAALGADDLPIALGGETIKFPWFDPEADGEQAKAYATLVSMLCKTAIKKKRINAKERDIEGSPKYAMRCFLLRLGFIGDEYKEARRVLLSGFSGSSSQKSEKPKGEKAPGPQNAPRAHALDRVREQALAIRDSGGANMFDVNAVKRIATASGFGELLDFIDSDRPSYANFILTGELPLA